MDGPPPPPPHGTNPKTTGGSGGTGGTGGTGGLPAGNYDIFIIPPHSSGGGFVYLPSLQVQRNSFLAGVASTLASIAVWIMIEPTVKQWFIIVSQSVSAGGNGVVLLVAVVGIAGWAWGKTQGDGGGFGGAFGGGGPGGGAGAGASGSSYQRAPPPPPHGSYPGAGSPPPQGAHRGWHGQHQQRGTAPPPPQEDGSWSGSQADAEARANWEKAREDTRKKDEERKKAEEARKRAEEAREKAEEAQQKKEEERKAKEEADRQARAKAEKEKWEKMRAREREQRERDARERIARERAQKERDAKDKEERDRQAREAAAREKIEREIREKLEAEQRAKAAEEAARRAEEAKVAAERKAAEEKEAAIRKAAEEKEAAIRKAAEDQAAREAAAAKAKADADRAQRLKAARERAQRDREARLKAEADKLRAQAAASAPAETGRRSTTYGGIGAGERLDPYAGSRSPPAPSVTSTRTSPIKATVTPKKNYEKPSAKSYVGTEDEHSFRPYDTPGARRPPKPPSHASSSYTASSYAASQSTARTTPPPSQRGPYSTNDPDKIQIKAVYLFNDLFPKPVAQLVSNVGKVTDGLILKIQSEGLFIDDDVRNIPQREWDVKAWTLKLVQTGVNTAKGLHIFCAHVRDADGKKYVFLIDDSESWKLAVGLQRLRKKSQVFSLQNSQMAPSEVTRILNSVPPV